MRRLFASLFTLVLMTASPAFAVMEDYPSVKLQGLDKSVGRTVTFEAKVGSTIQYGPLFIKIQSCRKAPPIEKPESAAFLQIWEVPPGADKSSWVFSGWMFASSPALSAMNHPVYDVWVLDCTGKEQPNEEAEKAQTDQQADQTTLAPADKAATDGATTTPAANPATTSTDTDLTPAMSPTEAPTVDPNNIPTDSEGEDDAAPAGDEAAPNPDTDYPTDTQRPQPIVPDQQPAIPQDQSYTAPQPQTEYQVPAEQQPDTQTVDPADQKGVTAYDFMNQNRGTNAGPPPAAQRPAPTSAPQY